MAKDQEWDQEWDLQRQSCSCWLPVMFGWGMEEKTVLVGRRVAHAIKESFLSHKWMILSSMYTPPVSISQNYFKPLTYWKIANNTETGYSYLKQFRRILYLHMYSWAQWGYKKWLHHWLLLFGFGNNLYSWASMTLGFFSLPVACNVAHLHQLSGFILGLGHLVEWFDGLTVASGYMVWCQRS